MQWWLWKKHTDVYSSRLIAIKLQVQIRICNNIKSLSYCVIASLFTVASPYITNMSEKLKLEEEVAVRQTAGQNTLLKESRLFMCIATFWTFGFTFWHFFFLFIQKSCCLQTLNSNQYIFFEINTRHFVISIIQENTRTTLWWGNQM